MSEVYPKMIYIKIVIVNLEKTLLIVKNIIIKKKIILKIGKWPNVCLLVKYLCLEFFPKDLRGVL